MAITNSPLRYPGGKSALSPFLAETLSLNGAPAAYAEPFAGGAGAALNLLFEGCVNHIYINDADKIIYRFWKSVTENTECFLEKLRHTEITVDNWRECKGIIATMGDYSDLEVGFAAFFLNRSNHSGILSANPVGGIEQKGQWKITARFNKELLSKKIEKIASHSKNITVTNYDALDFLDYIDSKQDVFLFIDPPYYIMGKNLYLNYYREEDHAILSTRLRALRSKWLMTYDAVPQIKDLYRWCQLTDFSLNYCAKIPKRGSELIIYPHTVQIPPKVTPAYGLVRSQEPRKLEGIHLPAGTDR